MSLITDRLNLIFEDTSAEDNTVEVALEDMRKLDEAKLVVLELQNRLDISKRGIVGNLALGIRRQQHSALNIGVGETAIKVGYKSKHLLFEPDINNNVWSVSSPDDKFSKRFVEDFAPATILRSDVSYMAKAILEYFGNRFGEDIIGVGDGIIMVEGKKGNQLDIITWKGNRPRLMSRKTRRAM